MVAHVESTTGGFSADDVAAAIGRPNDTETIHHILEHLAANKRGVTVSRGQFRAAKKPARAASPVQQAMCA